MSVLSDIEQILIGREWAEVDRELERRQIEFSSLFLTVAVVSPSAVRLMAAMLMVLVLM